MKTAVVYYSMGGNTKWTAERIAEEVQGDLIPLEPDQAYPDKGFRKFFWGGKSAVMGEKPSLRPYSFDPGKYDAVLIGTPVWAGSFTPPVRTFLDENRMALQGKKLGVFVCFSGGGAEKAVQKMERFLDAVFDRTLILIDPKDKPSEETDGKIKDFCAPFAGSGV